MLESSQAMGSTVTSLVSTCRRAVWAVQCVESGLIHTWAGGQSAHPSLHAKSTRSLRLLQGSPGRNLVKHSVQARALWSLQQQAAVKLPLYRCSAGRVPRFARIIRRLSMNEPGAFEPFVDNIGSILKREIAMPIMYEQLTYNKILAYANQKYLEPWKMHTPMLRNPYASHVKPHQKPHPV